MARKILFIFSLIIALAGCGDSAGDAPDGLLAPAKMAEVMVDVQLLEASLNLGTMNPQRVQHVGSIARLDADVMKKHAITRKQYDESFNYYCLHPKQLSEVYQLVLNKLSRMQAEVMNAR
jgi:hypothetical protein